MKGAIGNALIMNIVITFVIIFFSLLIGSMAYSKAYKVKNYIINQIDNFETRQIHNFNSPLENKPLWDEQVNGYLKKMGYHLSTERTCPNRSDENYISYIWNDPGNYDYCIYMKRLMFDKDKDPIIESKYYYEVWAYMKFDFPVIGKTLRVPLKGDTKTYIRQKKI